MNVKKRNKIVWLGKKKKEEEGDSDVSRINEYGEFVSSAHDYPTPGCNCSTCLEDREHCGI